MLAQLFPLGVKEAGDKYTGGTLSAATQTQAGSIPAVKRGSLFVYVCDSMRLIQGKRSTEGYCQVGKFCLQGEG